MTDTATDSPVILIGRCPACSAPHRIEIAAAAADRYPNWRYNLEFFLSEQVRIAWPACANGHRRTQIKFTRGGIVKVTEAPEITCGNKCWQSKSATCSCSCKGRNHGGAHASHDH